MTRAVDDVILDALRATGVRVYDGLPLAPLVSGQPRQIEQPTPFVVYYSSIGYDDRGAARNGFQSRRSIYWQITYVGEDRNQAKWAGEKAREALRGQALDIPGHRSWRVSVESSNAVRRDDDAISSEGKPLFYGVDQYAMSITSRPVGVPA